MTKDGLWLGHAEEEEVLQVQGMLPFWCVLHSHRNVASCEVDGVDDPESQEGVLQVQAMLFIWCVLHEHACVEGCIEDVAEDSTTKDGRWETGKEEVAGCREDEHSGIERRYECFWDSAGDGADVW